VVASLDRLLRPRSVAIVGASDKPGALGASVLANLERAGFTGVIHLVNPKRLAIGERPCLPSVAALPDGVDVAVLAIPRDGVLDAVKGLAARGAGAVVIFSAGFAESGPDGLAEQKEIARVAAGAGMVVEGPNCLGLVNFADGVPLTFVEMPHRPLGPAPGLAILSQSGAMAAVLGVTLLSRDIGLSLSVSTGNEAASGVEDYLEWLVDDPRTRVITLVAEQFRQPRRFLAAARRARDAGKTIVLLHPGRSAAARASAATHTGVLAGDHAVMRAHVGQAGVVLVDTLEELGDVAEIAWRCPPLRPGGLGVLGESGAFKAIALDLAERLGLDLPAVTEADAPALRAALPPFVGVSNPLDITAQGLMEPALFTRSTRALLDDDRFGAVLAGIIQTDAATARIKYPALLAALVPRPVKPLVVAGLDEGAEGAAPFLSAFGAAGVPYFPTAERAIRALARLAAARDCDPGGDRAPPLALPALAGWTGVVPEYRAKAMLAPLVPFPPARIAATLEEAQAAADALGWPVVLKAQAAALPHKSDAGGTVVGLADPAALADGWGRLHRALAAARPDVQLDTVLVEAMGPRGVEMIVGARHDPDWGATMLVGFGGTEAEIWRDVRLLPADLTLGGIEAELKRLKGAPRFAGWRGGPPLDLRALAELVQRLSRLMRGEPRLREIDLNPVLVLPEGNGVLALDALLLAGGA
jgi:acyl-CoA synthetase (NDP forming)